MWDQEDFYWMKISLDKYELPLMVANSREELAEMAGVKANTISSCMSRAKKRGFRSQYIKIPKENEE